MPRIAKGEFYARKNLKFYPANAKNIPPDARWWFRITINGHRRAFSLYTSDKKEAIRRRDAWLAGLRLTSYEEFRQSIIENGRRAERELARELATKGVRPA